MKILEKCSCKIKIKEVISKHVEKKKHTKNLSNTQLIEYNQKETRETIYDLKKRVLELERIVKSYESSINRIKRF